MKQILRLDKKMCSLNEYINAERGNKFAAAKIKKSETDIVYWSCKASKLIPFTKPVWINFVWFVKDMRSDPDNICFAKKSILDGLVLAKVLKNDNLNWVKGFRDAFIVGNEEGIVVEIVEDKIV